MRATTTIPIVIGLIGDPVGAGVVSSIARPGANITGVSVLAAELEPKRLEILLAQRERVAAFVTNAKLPSAYTYREHVDAGGLLSYSTNYYESFRRAADSKGTRHRRFALVARARRSGHRVTRIPKRCPSDAPGGSLGRGQVFEALGELA
jgi:hypothetical protein